MSKVLRILFTQSINLCAVLTVYLGPCHCFARDYAITGRGFDFPSVTAQFLEVADVGNHHLLPVESYERVLHAITASPYLYDDLPVIPVKNYDFKDMKYNVGHRSEQILRERHVISPEYKVKPIHPMGIPVEGRMTFYKGSSEWSGVFRGGEFPVIARLSLSQGNPLKKEILENGEIIPQVRSSTMGVLLFDPSASSTERVPIVSLLLQNDLNGVVNPETGEANNFLDQTLLNKPEFDPSKLLGEEARIEHYGTLAGVFLGALKNEFEKTGKADHKGAESPRFGVDPLLRPPHGFANFGETDPEAIRPPVWLKVVPRLSENPEIVLKDDFRHEIFESLNVGSFTYDIHASDTIAESSGEKIWVHVGQFDIEKAHLPSLGADMGVIIPHADTTHRNYATGKSIYDYIQVIP